MYGQALALAILAGGTQAALEIMTDEGPQLRPPTTTVRGSGEPGSVVPQVRAVTYAHEGTTTVIRSGDLELTVLRIVPTSAPASAPEANVLEGTWPGQSSPALLASARHR